MPSKREIARIHPTVEACKEFNEAKKSLIETIEKMISPKKPDHEKSKTTMKTVIAILFAFITLPSFAQTANYTITASNDTRLTVSDMISYVYEIGPDTLDSGGSVDTLTVTLPNTFGGVYSLNFIGEIADITGSTTLTIDVMGAGCNTCEYIEEGTDDLAVDTTYNVQLLAAFYSPYIRLKLYPNAGDVEISGHLIIKPKQ